MNVNQVIKALKTTVQYSSNLYGAQPLVLSSAAKLLEDCMPYLKSDSTPAQALAQMHGDMDGLLGLLAWGGKALYTPQDDYFGRTWNPFKDDGDCARMENKCGVTPDCTNGAFCCGRMMARIRELEEELDSYKKAVEEERRNDKTIQ